MYFLPARSPEDYREPRPRLLRTAASNVYHSLSRQKMKLLTTSPRSFEAGKHRESAQADSLSPSPISCPRLQEKYLIVLRRDVARSYLLGLINNVPSVPMTSGGSSRLAETDPKSQRRTLSIGPLYRQLLDVFGISCHAISNQYLLYVSAQTQSSRSVPLQGALDSHPHVVGTISNMLSPPVAFLPAADPTGNSISGYDPAVKLRGL